MARDVARNDLRLPIGLTGPGEFRRLAQHWGFLLSWLRSGLPLPRKVSGTSCMATAFVLFAMAAKYYQDSPRAGEMAARRVSDVVENLRVWDIFIMPLSIARALGITIATGLLPLLVQYQWPETTRTLWRLSFSAVWIASVIFLMIVILRARSIFSTWPLRVRTLLRKIDWQAVFDSPVEVEVLTTDCRTGKTRVYSTKDLTNQDPSRMSTILCESMRLPGVFHDYEVDGICQVDGEIAGNCVIERFCQWRERYGAVFYIAYTLKADCPQGRVNFITDIVRSMSLQVYRHMHRKMRRYRRISAKDRRGRLPILHTILTQEAIPSLVFNSFSTKAMRAGIEQGGRIFQENLPNILRALEPLRVQQ